QIVKLRHIDRIEGRRARVGKVARDIDEGVSGVVTLGGGVELIKVADPLVLDQGGDRTPGDGQRARFYRLPLRSHPAVANDVGAADRLNIEGCIDALGLDLGWQQEDLARRATID